jgi:hypothetical protein
MKIISWNAPVGEKNIERIFSPYGVKCGLITFLVLINNGG